MFVAKKTILPESHGGGLIEPLQTEDVKSTEVEHLAGIQPPNAPSTRTLVISYANNDGDDDDDDDDVVCVFAGLTVSRISENVHMNSCKIIMGRRRPSKSNICRLQSFLFLHCLEVDAFWCNHGKAPLN